MNISLPAPPQRPLGRVNIAAIFLLALLTRAMVVAIVVFSYPRNWLFSKAPDLVFLAQSLRAGRGLSSPFGGTTGASAFVAPGYPALLASLFCIFGSDTYAAGVAMMAVQLLFAMLTIAVMLRLAHRCFGATVATVAGVFWALSPPLIWLPAVLWETSLSILLLTGMVALALRGLEQAGKAYWIVAGAYCGAAMLVNPSLTPAFCAVLGWAGYQTKPARIWEPWLCVLALLVVFAPWPLRNAHALHAFIPLRSNFGYEVWQGNHDGATGLFDATLEPLQNKQEYADYASEGEVSYMHHKTLLAQTYIENHPALFLKRSALRVLRFWTGAGSKENDRVVEIHAVITSFLGLAGLVMLSKQSRGLSILFLLPLLLFPLPYYLTHPDFRFRLVLDPLLTILGAYALVRVRGIAR